jgi:hypothetical protein
MEAYRTEATISHNGILTIRGVPFQAGDRVEVIVLAQLGTRQRGKRYALRGKPVRYAAPFDSVAEQDWNTLQ